MLWKDLLQTVPDHNIPARRGPADGVVEEHRKEELRDWCEGLSSLLGERAEKFDVVM